jgi:hypothetical protein
MTRWKAAAIHVVIGLLLISTIAVGVVLLWFPAGLWHVAGLQQLFGIMVAADIVLGPLLTLIVFRKGKPGLKFDLFMIGLAQACFLAYGVYTLWLNRPLYLVGSDYSFALVFASEINEIVAEDKDGREWPRFAGHGPWLVGVDLSSETAREEAAFAFAMGGGGPLRDSSLYVGYETVAASVLRRSRKVPARIPMKQPGERARAAALVSIRSTPSVVLLDAVSGKPIRVVR